MDSGVLANGATRLDPVNPDDAASGGTTVDTLVVGVAEGDPAAPLVVGTPDPGQLGQCVSDDKPADYGQLVAALQPHGKSAPGLNGASQYDDSPTSLAGNVVGFGQTLTPSGGGLDGGGSTPDSIGPSPAGAAEPAAGATMAASGGAAFPNPEMISLPGSGLVFENTYDSSVTAGYRTAIIAAENFLQSEFSDSVTLNLKFVLGPVPGGSIASNSGSFVKVTYSDLVKAWQTHATSPEQKAAVAALPTADPSGTKGFDVFIGEAEILGLAPAGTTIYDWTTQQPRTGTFDDTVTLGTTNGTTAFDWTTLGSGGNFGQDAVGVLDHEITEQAMGRAQYLGWLDSNGTGFQYPWAPADVFRYAPGGTQPDYSGGTDGLLTYFSIDGKQLSTQAFHNPPTAGVYNGDFIDWQDTPSKQTYNSTYGDSFGPGGPGIASYVTATDLQVMTVLGWTPIVETVTTPGSGLVFNNQYGQAVTAAFRSAVDAAEQAFESHFTNHITINLIFDLEPFPSAASIRLRRRRRRRRMIRLTRRTSAIPVW